MKKIIGDYETFVGNIDDQLKVLEIDRFSELAMCDHLCYRVQEPERYIEMSKILGRHANLIGEVEVGGRPISTFELDKPLVTSGWTIPCIELPSPKEGSFYPEGLEHAEFVVIGSLDKFATRHRNLPFDAKAMNKTVNPELGLKTDHLSVKFHEIALGAVVRLEKRLHLD